MMSRALRTKVLFHMSKPGTTTLPSFGKDEGGSPSIPQSAR